MTSNITETTNVKLKLSTAWSLLVSIIATTVWLSILMVKIHNQNQVEHTRLMMSLTELNLKSENWVTHAQLEEALMFFASEVHSNHMDFWRETALREGIRKRIARK